MTPPPIRHLSAAEAARALGVSTRALRLYEQKGLVRPARTTAGWRAYGPDTLARLHQILALKGLGLSLTRIGDLLQGRLSSLEAVLGLQEEALVLRRAETDRALELVRRAKAALAAGRSLTVDDLTTLTRGTVMTEPIDDEAMKQLFQPFIARHFDDESLNKLKNRPYDQAAASQAWAQLIADAKAAHAKGDPTTPEAIDVGRRWQALLAQFHGGDPDLARRAMAVWTDVRADPEARAKLPHNPELLEFIRQATLAGHGAED